VRDHRRRLKNENRVQAAWGLCTVSLVQPISVRMSGTIDSFQRWYGELGTVELVEPGSAVVDEGELAVARQGFAVPR
jgi:hypothetical protein